MSKKKGLSKCDYCGGLGDVYGLYGAWSGICQCPAGEAIRDGAAEFRKIVADAKDGLMIRHLIYASIIHDGWLKTQKDHEKAADRVIDMLQRGGYIFHSEAHHDR